MPAATPAIRYVRTQWLEIAYEESGRPDGEVIILLHGFPYAPRCFDEVVPPLATAGYRVIVPYLRGYGGTRFLSSHTMRSGQQAAVGQDVIDLMDALGIQQAALMGFDWGGRAACIAAALWPARVRCLVTALGYVIQDIAAASAPQSPAAEHRLWYQYYFHSPRGRAGLTANRAEIGKFLWRLWSPSWHFTDATYEATAAAFVNPDFVDVVVHSYRHRFGYEPGDPTYEALERALARQPVINVPTIALCGGDEGIFPPPATAADCDKFTSRYDYRVLPGIGHNIPQEAPAATVAALFDLLQ
ncbi:MAG: alpha/beta hydrolase [Acidocella sp. 20-57-95]|nr:MAG: alpha/beta hydrolase [Acidocella sp. 20-57-95]HQT63622.1 alpha/beta hydrolase [Acidocella sp.]HQU05519.1 alpha/beta hydrolase [Acidocella sp.]